MKFSGYRAGRAGKISLAGKESHSAGRAGSSFRAFFHPLAALVLFALPEVCRADAYFPPELVAANPENIADLSRLTPSGTQLPGTYEVDIYLNGSWLISRSVRFVAVDTVPAANTKADRAAFDDVRDRTGLMACLTSEEWRDIGLKINTVSALANFPQNQCLSPGRYIPQAYTAFDFKNMRLDISIPQAMLKNRPQGWISPERWDEGINALLLGYKVNGSHSEGKYSDSDDLYINLDNGLNIGPWRLRDNRTWTRYSASEGRSHSEWDRLNTYVERGINALQSQLLLGEGNTDGDLFDPLAFRGAMLSTNDSMYPDTQRGFAPLIKGAAYSNAKVSIRQNNSLIYQTNVSPGAFVIDDLYPVSSGGDLDVTVTEADGSTRTFVVPYSSVPLLQREGRVRYSLVAGRFRSNSGSYDDPLFGQGTLQWGLPYDTTLYGGVQGAEHYRAAMLGGGVNMGNWGAVSLDVTHADSELADGSRHQGQSLRFLYARSMSSLGTTVRLSGYRYSTKGFHTLDETALKGMSGWLSEDDTVDAAGRPVKRPYTDYYNLYDTRRMRIQANITQSFGKWGSLFLTGSRQNYWNSDDKTDSLMAGYNGTLGVVNWNLSWSYSKANSQPGSDRMMYLSFSLPFSALLPGHDTTSSTTILTGNMSHVNGGRETYMAGMGGSLLADNNLNWNIQEGYSKQGNNNDGDSGDSGNASLDYRGTYGGASLGYSYAKDYRQVSYGVSGGAVVHRNGLTFGQTPGTTSVLVAAPGAPGVLVQNGTGVKTDWQGYALLPYSMEYRENTISLDAENLDEFTELDSTSTRVVPTRGALVRADFKAHRGFRVLMRLTRNGKPLPFGTTVTAESDSKDGSSGITGDDGVVYLSGLAQEGTLKAQWGNNPDQQCTVTYRLTEQQMQQSPIQISETCVR